nr:MAG TPA: hypothetical protein [Caudoviricetes sp.]
MYQKTLPVDTLTRNSRYALHTDLRNMNNLTYCLYKRKGELLILVDTFSAHKKPNKEAQQIIQNCHSLKNLIKNSVSKH